MSSMDHMVWSIWVMWYGGTMKTTVELPDGLLKEAKRIAKREGTTVRALLEQGLRRALEERLQPRAFELRDGSVGGQGLNPELAGAPWDVVRDLVYRGHGS